MRNAEQWIKELDMSPLPEEGGWFKEVYRSDEFIPKNSLPDRFQGKRTFSTSIYYLLKSDEFSAFHRIKQDEIWHFYEGSSLTIHIIDQSGTYKQIKLGRDFDSGECFQATIDKENLLAATVKKQGSFSLIGCTVAPGFEFEDFEAPNRSQLLELYPEHKVVITKLTR
ncbi:MAG: cupin domain-containing protein [Bacteroidales bacterium]|nr:cupin domain-containing protein [Bacteroidales bacterium]